MRYEIIRGRELTANLARRWAQIQEASDDLASPYFRPEFTEAVAAVRRDVHIGVLEDGGRIVGFFPFHRRRGGFGRPIGLGLSDYHGVIAEPNAEWAAEDLLRGSGLVRYDFDHLLASQRPFASSHSMISASPVIDLAYGYKTFESTRDKAGRKQIRESDRKRQKLNDQVAPVRFIEDSIDADALTKLIGWKSAQCQRTGTVDFFAREWCVRLLQQIHESRTREFGGVLSCLYVGDDLAAAHLAMRSSRVWHSWFPGYSDEFRSYSPGMILLLEVTRAAARRRIGFIDLGKGMSLYKRRFMTGAIRVAEGCVETPSWLNTARHVRESVEQWARSSRLMPILRLPGRVVKQIGREHRYD